MHLVHMVDKSMLQSAGNNATEKEPRIGTLTSTNRGCN